jgi:short-subunit dehydrogenase
LINGQAACSRHGASTGFGCELAKCCAEDRFDLIVAADEPEIKKVAADFAELGAKVDAVEADLATIEGVDKVYAVIGGRQVDALLANAGRGLGKDFLDQDFDDVLQVVNTNITARSISSRKSAATCGQRPKRQLEETARHQVRGIARRCANQRVLPMAIQSGVLQQGRSPPVC